MYAHNNPLKFVDADGEFPAVVVGAVLGGLINLGVGIWRGEVHDLWDGIVYFGTGAAIGALAGATGGASLAGGATSVLGGIYSGAITGAATGAWSGMLQGIANATWQTIRYHAPTENIAKAGAEGLVAGAVGGAIIGGTVGGIQAAWRGTNIWTGAAKAPKVTATPAGTVEIKPLEGEMPAWENPVTGEPIPAKPIRITPKLSQFTQTTIDESIRLAISDPNKLNHLFPAKHNLDPLVQQLGSQENVVKAVLNAANGQFPATTGRFGGIGNELAINVSGYTVYIKGNIVNGVPRLGTMFIK